MLALLDGRLDIEPDDWHLAGQIVALSRQTRDRAIAAVAQQGAEANRRRGEAEGERESVKRGKDFQRACRAVLRKLDRADGQPVRRKPLRDVCGPVRDYFEAAVDHLERGGEIEVKRDAEGDIEMCRRTTGGGA